MVVWIVNVELCRCYTVIGPEVQEDRSQLRLLEAGMTHRTIGGGLGCGRYNGPAISRRSRSVPVSQCRELRSREPCKREQVETRYQQNNKVCDPEHSDGGEQVQQGRSRWPILEIPPKTSARCLRPMGGEVIGDN